MTLKKLSYFVSNKDKLLPLSRSNLVYEVASWLWQNLYWHDTKMPFCAFERACNYRANIFQNMLNS
jgi:hypothetical protein